VGRPPGARVIDLPERTVSPGFIDTHVHLTIDAADLALQTLQSSAAKALKGLSLAREYMTPGFTTLRDRADRRRAQVSGAALAVVFLVLGGV
jgi:imidazolonepropionase-like amidohydrolase